MLKNKKMNYRLNIEAKVDYTQMSIMAGELYLIDEKNRKSHISGMALGEENLHYFFIENNTKFIFIVLDNVPMSGVNQWVTQIGIADLETETINFYDKYFSNNGEIITYENGVVTVHNDNNDYAKTESFDVKTTAVGKTKRFKIFNNDKFSRMEFSPTESEAKEEVDRLAMEIYHSYHIDSEKFNNPNITTIRNLITKWEITANDYADKEELIYEWQNDMDARRLIDELIPTLDPAIQEMFNIELKTIDDKVKAKTFEVKECIWGIKNEAEKKYNRKDNWYYYRINQLIFDNEKDNYTKR